MRTRKEKDMFRLKQAALGKIASDLTIKNIRLFNVFTGEVYPAEVDVLDGYVVRIREAHQPQIIVSKSEYDGQGNILVPGFIDTHMHVESTMMIPENLSRAIVPWGTTTICTDPHEIGNAMGIDGVKFMIENSKKSKLRQYVLAPSCVPAVVGLEETGASFTSKEVAELLDSEGVVGIAEVMDYVGVINNEQRMASIVEEGLKRNTFIQGHSPFLQNEGLAAYLIGGPCSDHESALASEVKEKIRNGMYIDLRASSLDNSSKEIVEGLKGNEYYDFVTVCTDDVHAKDLMMEGHINRVIKSYISAGLNGKALYRMATLNAAREYGFHDLGAIAPGYLADMQIIRDFDGSMPKAVFIEGELVGQDGEYMGKDVLDEQFCFPNTVNIAQCQCEDDFKLHVPSNYTKDTIKVNVMVPTDGVKFLCHLEEMELPVKEGCVDISSDPSLVYIMSANRFGTSNKTLSVYKDFGLYEGALASTVAHDNHNLTIVYHTAKEALLCAKTLQKCAGGVAIVRNQEVSVVELPVAGLMSAKPCKEVTEQIEQVQKVLSCIAEKDVHLLTTAIMSLTVLPAVVITDLGLVDGNTQKILPVFVE